MAGGIEDCVVRGQTYAEQPLRIYGDKHEITIGQRMNGFVVQVGCRTLVFESQQTLIAELNRYLGNRAAVEKEYLDKYK